MESFFKDLKQSLRMFWRSPGFTIAALAALTLGIGTNTAIFSVVNAVLLKPIPFPDPDRLVMLMNTSPDGSFAGGSPAKFIHWRGQSEVLEDVAAFNTGVVNYTGGDVPEQLRSGRVTESYFRTFGAPIVRGRTFSAEEDRPNGDKVAVISHGLWVRRFGSDPNVLGRTISISGDPHTIIGIVGPTFNVAEFGPQPEVWLAFQFDPETKDQGHYFRVAARLKPGISLEQAQARLKLSAKEFETRFPKALGPNESFSVTPFQEAFVQDARKALLVLVGAVSFVLLIACANVANLLLVRATGRKREIAIRSAIGAARGRILRQLLTESVVLSLAGGVLGLGLGLVAIRALLSINTAGLPRMGEGGSLVGLDWRVLVVHAGRVSRHGHHLRPLPGASGFARRSQPHAEGERRSVRHVVQAEQDAIGPGRRRGRAGAHPAHRVGAAHSHVAGAPRRRSGLRSAQRADDADVADRAALPDIGRRRADGARRRRAAARAARRRARQRDLLRAACREGTACRS